MFKTLGKLKSTKKKIDKLRPDDGQTITKASIKEKDKTRGRSKKKKTHSSGDASHSHSSGEMSRTTSQILFEDHSELYRLKGNKKPISKECEDAVSDAVSDFFNGAWLACAERFFIKSAPVTVSYELRNTWLRIVEAEWQDPEMRETSYAKRNRIFEKDEPPLPLAFDTWSRGALEPMPQSMRESIFDPFLRDLNYLKDHKGSGPPPEYRVPSPSPQIYASDAGLTLKEDEIHINVLEPSMGEIQLSTVSRAETPNQDASVKNEWNLELDETFRPNFQSDLPANMPETAYPLSSASQYSQESPVPVSTSGDVLEKKYVYTLTAAKVLNLKDSTTDIEYSPPSSARLRKPKEPPEVVPKFSPSQCGGNDGFGVFRLFNETTDEALLARRKSQDNVRTDTIQIEEQNAENQEDIVQITTKGRSTQYEQSEQFEVQPLFVERTPYNRSQQETTSGRLSNNLLRENRGRSLDQVASDVNERFLKRRIVHLRGHFKRQAMRSLAMRTKEALERQAIMNEHERNSSPDSTTASSIFSFQTNKSKRNKTENRKNSVSASDLRRSIFSSSSRRSIAKRVASEPQLPSLLQERKQESQIREAVPKPKKPDNRQRGMAQTPQKQGNRQRGMAKTQPKPENRQRGMAKTQSKPENRQRGMAKTQSKPENRQREMGQTKTQQKPETRTRQLGMAQTKPKSDTQVRGTGAVQMQKRVQSETSATTRDNVKSTYSFKSTGNVQPTNQGGYLYATERFSDNQGTQALLHAEFERKISLRNDEEEFQGTPSDCLLAGACCETECHTQR